MHDEQFLGNPAFVNKDTHDTVVRMKEDMDHDRNGQLTLQELKQFFSSVTDFRMTNLVLSLLEPEEAEKHKLRELTVQRIFSSIDTNNNGTAERGELLTWINTLHHDKKLQSAALQWLIEVAPPAFALESDKGVDMSTFMQFMLQWTSAQLGRVADLLPKLAPQDVPLLSVLILAPGLQDDDVLPFAMVGLKLKALGHRVRVASHDSHRPFVTRHGLEFYPLAADPTALQMSLLKSRGRLGPVLGHICGSEGMLFDTKENKQTLRDLFLSCWDAATLPDPADPHRLPFHCDAIISSPCALAHLHVAEALGVPLSLLHTAPWSPTAAFAHPLAARNCGDEGEKEGKTPKPSFRVRRSGGPDVWLEAYKAHIKNPQTLNRTVVSYKALDWLIWTGTEKVVNDFRSSKGLDALSVLSGGPYLCANLCVPASYLYSERVMARPVDYGPHIDVCGFVACPAVAPPREKELLRFFSTGPCLGVSFGDCLLPNDLTKVQIPNSRTDTWTPLSQALGTLLLAACRDAGLRLVLLARPGLGEDVDGQPDVFVNRGPVSPHWLFPRCAVVLHHGGADCANAAFKVDCTHALSSTAHAHTHAHSHPEGGEASAGGAVYGRLVLLGRGDFASWHWASDDPIAAVEG